MRHVGSLLLAAIFTPAVFLLTGTGLSAFGSARSGTFIDDPLSTLAALGALLLAGVLYGILVMVRLSPLGPGMAGLVLMGTSGWALVAPQSYDDTFGLLDVHMGGAVGQWGLGILLGVPLVATLTSPRRWRTDPYPPSDAQPGYYPAQPALTPQQMMQQSRPSIPDATKQMPAQPAYMTLPDIAPPSLGYPAMPQAPAPAGPPPPPPAAKTARPAATTPPVAPLLTPAAPPPSPVVQTARPAATTPPAPPAPPPPPSAAPAAPPPPPPAAPDAARLSPEAIPLPKRVPGPPPGGLNTPPEPAAAEDATVKISVEGDEATKPLT